MLKKLLFNPSLLLILIGNGWCIWYFNQNPNGFSTIVWIYWWQSVIIGIFNFIDLATLKSYNPGTLKINGTPVGANKNGCVASFFLVHYGIFHLVYFVFLITKYNVINKNTVLLCLGSFLLEALWTLRHKKIYEQTNNVNIGVVMFLPYIRIVPMHLIIMVPAFLGITPTLLFLVLKTFADIVFHEVSTGLYQKNIQDK